MTDLSSLLNEISTYVSSLQMQVTHMDKDTMIALGYSCWLYMITDAATRGGSRRRAHARHRH